MLHELINAIEETLFMVFFSSLITVLIGFPLSVLQILPHRHLNAITRTTYKLLDVFIHLVCTIPYIVIMIALIPIIGWLIGSHESNFIAIIPLTMVAIPLFTRVCTKAFRQIPTGLLDVAISLGASTRHLVFKVLIPEALPNIIYGFSQVMIQLMTFAVIVGVLGAGGIGKLLLEKGYQDYQTVYVIPIILTLVALVMLIQYAGLFLAFGSFKQIDSEA